MPDDFLLDDRSAAAAHAEAEESEEDVEDYDEPSYAAEDDAD